MIDWSFCRRKLHGSFSFSLLSRMQIALNRSTAIHNPSEETRKLFELNHQCHFSTVSLSSHATNVKLIRCDLFGEFQVDWAITWHLLSWAGGNFSHSNRENDFKCELDRPAFFTADCKTSLRAVSPKAMQIRRNHFFGNGFIARLGSCYWMLRKSLNRYFASEMRERKKVGQRESEHRIQREKIV